MAVVEVTLPQPPEGFLNTVVKCLACRRESSIRDLKQTEYLPMLEGFFCPCDVAEECPLGGMLCTSGVASVYLAFAEIVRRPE